MVNFHFQKSSASCLTFFGIKLAVSAASDDTAPSPPQTKCSPKKKASHLGLETLCRHPGIAGFRPLRSCLTTHAVFIVANKNTLEIFIVKASRLWKTLKRVLFTKETQLKYFCGT